MTLLAAAQNAWRRTPLPLRRLAAPLLEWATRRYASGGRPVSATGQGRLPIKVVGLFSAASGIGASARLAVRAFETLGISVEAVDASAEGLDFSRRLTGTPQPAIWIFHLNPPELLAALASLGPKKVLGPRYGYWAWELPKAPDRWLSDARVVDEVWTPSRYSADALAGAAAPVRVVPHPLFAQDYEGVEPLPRRAPFEAVAVFDFRSSMARKNPLGAIEAFRRAFGDDPSCELTLKTQNGADFPDQLAALRAAIPPNARLIDEVWPYDGVKRLIAGADVLISLHRAEGFGLTPAEAMALGTPVLASAYSGALDFLDETCAILVPFAMTPVEDPQGVYRGQTWAEPDLDVAAAGLKRLREDAWLRSTLAEAGRRRMAERLSPTAWFATLPETVRAAIRVAPASRPGPV
jgi:glycosyltransferase involved in cell wall biosynthesis